MTAAKGTTLTREPITQHDRNDQRGFQNRQNDTPLDGLEELIVALHDIGEILNRPSPARLARIARAAEQVTGPPRARSR